MNFHHDKVVAQKISFFWKMVKQSKKYFLEHLKWIDPSAPRKKKGGGQKWESGSEACRGCHWLIYILNWWLLKLSWIYKFGGGGVCLLWNIFLIFSWDCCSCRLSSLSLYSLVLTVCDLIALWFDSFFIFARWSLVDSFSIRIFGLWHFKMLLRYVSAFLMISSLKTSGWFHDLLRHCCELCGLTSAVLGLSMFLGL